MNTVNHFTQLVIVFFILFYSVSTQKNPIDYVNAATARLYHVV